ncbi:GNAT family N-acetyltransferase [Halobacteriales archaeon SW_7_68_16]|nr:MAG: GNAT family N-acetyltransferase [Halobacteriales archaeon SW_7_68_16]
MEIRQATTADATGIREVALASLRESYGFLGEAVIEQAVESWYGDDVLSDELADPETVYIVADAEVDDGTTPAGDVLGFAQSHLTGAEPVGEISWLHAAPEARESGVADSLLEYTADVLYARGARRIRGIVLAQNDAGVEFYRSYGFESAGEEPVEIEGEQFVEHRFERTPAGDADPRPDRRRATADGDRIVYVATDGGERGTLGRFRPTYTDRENDELYGWFCENCNSFATAMDTMGRIECTDCDNARRPTRWDAAYL